MTRLGQSPVAGPAAAPDPHSGSDSCGRPAAQLRVLVIAADGALRNLLTDALQGEGFEVLAAVDPDSAGIAGAEDGRLSLVLLDLGLVRPAGRFLEDWSRRRPGPHAPLVLLSTEDVAETVAAVEAAGAVGFLRLPCDLDDLLALVRRAALPATAPAAPTLDPPPVALESLAPRAPGGARAGGEEAAEARRRRLLQRLARDVGELRPAVVKVRDELRALLIREQAGPLAPLEQRRLAALRRELEAQQLRLRECRAEFERLRGAADGPP
jgi:DNA-binding response OmpR family regulator